MRISKTAEVLPDISIWRLAMTYIIIIVFIFFRESSLPEGTTSILSGYVLLEIGEPANCLDAER